MIAIDYDKFRSYPRLTHWFRGRASPCRPSLVELCEEPFAESDRLRRRLAVRFFYIQRFHLLVQLVGARVGIGMMLAFIFIAHSGRPGGLVVALECY